MRCGPGGYGPARLSFVLARRIVVTGRPQLRVVCIVLTVAVAVAVVRAQSEPPSSGPAGSPPGIGLAEQPYVDGTFGFSIRPFAEATVIRQKETVEDGDVELVQFLNYRLNWGLAVRLARTTRALSPDEMLEGLAEKLARSNPDIEIFRKDKLTLAGRPAVRLAGSCTVGRSRWLRQQAVIFLRPDEFFVIIFNAPLGYRAQVEPLFDAIVGSFEILRSEVMREQIEKALERGARFLSSVDLRRRPADNLIQEGYMRFVIDGRDAGYVWLQERRTTFEKRDGVFLRQEGWLFEPDGTVKRQLSEIFASDDMTRERWSTRAEVIPPAEGSTPPRVLVTLEQGMREGDKLVLAYTGSPNAVKMTDKVLELPDGYAPQALFSLFPRMIDLSRPDLYAFAAYNSDRRGFVIRTLRVVGRQDILLDGRSVRTTRLEDSEGLVPPITENYVDPQGRLVRVVAGKLEMIATPPERIRSLYGEKVAAVDRALRPPRPRGEPAGPAEGKAGAPKGRS